MSKLSACLPILLLCTFSSISFAQILEPTASESGGEYPIVKNDAEHPCVNEQQYAEIEQQCAKNRAALGLPEAGPENVLTTALNWPLQAAPGFNDCSFYIISAYVDQNTAATTFSDWNCGAKSYDGHRGTDIATFPFHFYKMDFDQVQVVAAAAGTIINKVDGNFDKNCAANNGTANYIVIQHADGSTALYLHMKKNSLTAKIVGQSVAAGEFLGIVGSSGNSSGPHLHFEVWAGSTVSTRVDPYAGPCNLLNANSWWAVQKPYTEPAVIKASVHTTDIVVPACPATETPNESNCYPLPFQGSGLPANMAKFYIFFRNETNAMVANMSILNPDGSTFTSWTYTSTANYTASYRSHTKALPTNAGTYTFQASYNGLTCSSTFDVMKATITPSGSTTICQGNSVMLTANAGSTYLWSNGATTQSITVSSAGSYTVTVTNAHSCSAASTATTVTVNPPPATPTISAGGATTFCQGGSVMLNSSAGTAYAWSNGATTQGITASSSGNYSVTVTYAGGCTAVSAATVVTVNPPPSAVISAGGPTTFCQGASVMLSVPAANTYLWSTGATTQSITVSNAGNYKVTVGNASGCTAVSSVTAVTVNPLPSAVVSATGPLTFCQGASVMLSAPAGNTYAWSTGATTQNITVSSTGSYMVTVTNANACSAVSTATTVTVNPLPSASVSAGGPTTFCLGGSVVLSVAAGNTYMWNTGATTQNLSVSTTGNYAVTVTNASGCSAVSSATPVTVNNLPNANVTAGGPTTFCQGGSVDLSAPPGNTYLWSTGATTQNITVSNTGNYTVTVTNVNGCTAVSPAKSVTVNPLPAAVVTAGGPTTICQGGSVMLTAAPGNTYLWSTGFTTQSIVISSAGNYIVTVTNANGCSAVSSATTVTVNISPVNAVNTNGPTTFCQGGSVVLSAAAGNTYLWSTGATTQNITVSSSGNYTVSLSNAGGCSAVSAATVVTVNPLPSVAVTAGGPTTFCQGGSVVLTATQGSSYLWSTGASTQSITVSSTGNYAVTVTNASACSAVSSATAVTANPAPAIPTISGNGAVLTSSSATGNQWFLNGSLIAGATNQVFTATQNGNYVVMVTNAAGCSASSAVFNYMNTATQDADASPVFLIAPNPNTGIFRIETRDILMHATVEIFNALGEPVFQATLQNSGLEVDLSAQPSGLYLVWLHTGEGMFWRKMIKI